MAEPDPVPGDPWEVTDPTLSPELNRRGMLRAQAAIDRHEADMGAESPWD